MPASCNRILMRWRIGIDARSKSTCLEKAVHLGCADALATFVATSSSSGKIFSVPSPDWAETKTIGA